MSIAVSNVEIDTPTVPSVEVMPAGLSIGTLSFSVASTIIVAAVDEDSVTVPLTGISVFDDYIRWSDDQSLGSTFAASGLEQVLSLVDLNNANPPGRVRISITGLSNDFTPAFEATGRIIFEASDGELLEVMIADADMAEIYQWTPSNSAEVVAFVLHVKDLTDQSATITLSGAATTSTDVETDAALSIGTLSIAVSSTEIIAPVETSAALVLGSLSLAVQSTEIDAPIAALTLADFDDTGLDVIVLGLVTAGAREANNTLYRDSTNGPALGSLSADSDFVVQTGQSITRIALNVNDTAGSLRFWDQPSASTFSGFFPADTTYVVRFQADVDTVYEFVIDSQGNNFSNWVNTDAADAMTAVIEGGSFILAIVQPAVVADVEVSPPAFGIG